ncbi:MAG TPA: TonB-dependent receptor [Albitalea sp.]|nr:TonB-dependent receptor [Albitalea sp.]
MNRLNYVTHACLAGTLIGATAAQADNGVPPEQLERVMITAEKRETVLEMTPDAITVLNGNRLQERGSSALADVVDLVPNVSFTSNRDTTQIFIRGIGNVFITAGGDPGVALYTDGAYISDMTSANSSLFDVQRVEVLRGPQGALYGRNATGGAMNIISNTPTSEFRAQVGVLFGDYGRKETEGFISGPLGGGGTKARLSYQVKKLDGFTDNQLAGQSFGPVLPGGPNTVGTKALDDLDSKALRLQTMTELPNSGSLRLIAGVYRQHDAGASNAVLPEPTPTIPQLLFGASVTGDPRSVKSQGATRRIDVDTLQAIYDQPIGASGDKQLTIVASYRKSRADVFADGDLTEASVATVHFLTSSRDMSIDAHLASDDSGPLRWLVGATYLKFDQKQDIDVSTVIPLGFVVPGQPLNIPVPLQFLLGGNVHTKSTAAYADLRYALTPKLALLGGLRVSRDNKTADEYLNVATFNINPPPGAPSASWSSMPGSIGLEYQINPDVLTYAKVAHGFKSGAINLSAFQEPVKPETVTSFEVGTKISFLNRRASLSAAVFTSKYKDMQVMQIGQATPVLANVDGAKISGLEIEAMVKPVPSLTLGASIGLMDPKYTRFVNTDERHGVANVDVSGNQLAFVSKAQANLSAEWVQTFGDYRTSLRADYAWRDKVYFTEFNTADAMQDAYGMLNLAASFRPTSGRWKLYGYVRNANNKTALTSMSIASPVLGGARTVNYTPPRHFGVGFTYDF